jgi:hypothetical protein
VLSVLSAARKYLIRENPRKSVVNKFPLCALGALCGKKTFFSVFRVFSGKNLDSYFPLRLSVSAREIDLFISVFGKRSPTRPQEGLKSNR